MLCMYENKYEQEHKYSTRLWLPLWPDTFIDIWYLHGEMPSTGMEPNSEGVLKLGPVLEPVLRPPMLPETLRQSIF